MVVAKQMDVRANIKKYFDIAFDGEPVIVPRKENKNVIIISESIYNELMANSRMTSYADHIGGMIFEKGNPPGRSVDKNMTEDVRTFNLNKLEKISELKKGWNGNGALPLPKKLIKRVGALLDALCIQPEIFPTALQTIQFEFDNARRDHMEIEIGMDDEAEVFIARYDGTESFENIPVSAEAIDNRVRAFYG